MNAKKTVNGLLGTIGLGCFLAACHPAVDLQAVSAGFAHCHPSEIIVGNDETHGWLREWDAPCKDEEWHCVRPTWARTSTAWVGTECRRVDAASTPARVCPAM